MKPILDSMKPILKSTYYKLQYRFKINGVWVDSNIDRFIQLKDAQDYLAKHPKMENYRIVRVTEEVVE